MINTDDLKNDLMFNIRWPYMDDLVENVKKIYNNHISSKELKHICTGLKHLNGFSRSEKDFVEIKKTIKELHEQQKKIEDEYKTVLKEFPQLADFREDVSGLTSIYHYTNYDGLKKIIKSKFVKSSGQLVEEGYDYSGLFSRISEYIFAYPTKIKEGCGKGNIILELRVNPLSMPVCDQELYTSGRLRDKLMEKYVNWTTPLEIYNDLDLDFKLALFCNPEVLIKSSPYSIKKMRLAKPAGIPLFN